MDQDKAPAKPGVDKPSDRGLRAENVDATKLSGTSADRSERSFRDRKSQTGSGAGPKNVIDQRQQQIDPAGKHRVDPNDAAKRFQKQPGQDLRDPQKDDDNAE